MGQGFAWGLRFHGIRFAAPWNDGGERVVGGFQCASARVEPRPPRVILASRETRGLGLVRRLTRGPWKKKTPDGTLSRPIGRLGLLIVWFYSSTMASSDASTTVMHAPASIVTVPSQ